VLEQPKPNFVVYMCVSGARAEYVHPPKGVWKESKLKIMIPNINTKQLKVFKKYILFYPEQSRVMSKRSLNTVECIGTYVHVLNLFLSSYVKYEFCAKRKWLI
jgi:hypothetical protein